MDIIINLACWALVIAAVVSMIRAAVEDTAR